MQTFPYRFHVGRGMESRSNFDLTASISFSYCSPVQVTLGTISFMSVWFIPCSSAVHVHCASREMMAHQPNDGFLESPMAGSVYLWMFHIRAQGIHVAFFFQSKQRFPFTNSQIAITTCRIYLNSKTLRCK